MSSLGDLAIRVGADILSKSVTVKHRKDIPLREALAIFDARLARSKEQAKHLRDMRKEEQPELSKKFLDRKAMDIRIERILVEQLRRQVSRLRYTA